MHGVMEVIDIGERRSALVNYEQGVLVSVVGNWPAYSVRPSLKRIHDQQTRESQV